jgi:hypothetical protein
MADHLRTKEEYWESLRDSGYGELIARQARLTAQVKRLRRAVEDLAPLDGLGAVNDSLPSLRSFETSLSNTKAQYLAVQWLLVWHDQHPGDVPPAKYPSPFEENGAAGPAQARQVDRSALDAETLEKLRAIYFDRALFQDHVNALIQEANKADGPVWPEVWRIYCEERAQVGGVKKGAGCYFASLPSLYNSHLKYDARRRPKHNAVGRASR